MTGMADIGAAVTELGRRGVNYDESQAPPLVTAGWHQDRVAVELGHEQPGPTQPGGLVETAMTLVDGYEFIDPHVLRAAFRDPDRLVGRDLLLEGRFLILRFLLGVRITAQHDVVRDGATGPERALGWSYQTLHGHLEQGRLTYEVVKDLGTGRVEFRIDAYSRRAPMRNPLFALGFGVFGRRTQLRFYAEALRRLKGLLEQPPAPLTAGRDGLVTVPSGVQPLRRERFAIRVAHPGR